MTPASFHHSSIYIFTRGGSKYIARWINSRVILYIIGVTIFFSNGTNFDRIKDQASFENICTFNKERSSTFFKPSNISAKKFELDRIRFRIIIAQTVTYQCECAFNAVLTCLHLCSRTENNAFKCKNNLPLYARSFTIPYLRRYVARVEYKIHAESRTFFFL